MYGSCLDLIIKEILEVIGGNLNMDWALNDIRVLFFLILLGLLVVYG